MIHTLLTFYSTMHALNKRKTLHVLLKQGSTQYLLYMIFLYLKCTETAWKKNGEKEQS